METFEKLIDLHEKIKEHPFRMNYAVPKISRTGAWKAEFNDYLGLIKDAAYTLSAIFWEKCYADPNNKIYVEYAEKKTIWLHDFVSLIHVIKNTYLIGFSGDKHLDIVIKNLNITVRELYDKLRISDIAYIMQYLEKFVGFVHRFIETRELKDMVYVLLQKTCEEHNGYYYRYLLTISENENGNWEINEKDYPKFETVKVQDEEESNC